MMSKDGLEWQGRRLLTMFILWPVASALENVTLDGNFVDFHYFFFLLLRLSGSGRGVEGCTIIKAV